MYAIIETGGKQYKVTQGDVLYVEKLCAEAEAEVKFPVIALHDDTELKCGNPYLDSVTVTGKVVKSGRGKKITVLTYKRRKGYQRKLGHRQPYTQVMIEKIEA